MKELKAREYKRFEDIKQIRADGTEFWSARELAPALEYTKMGKSLMQDEVDNAKTATSIHYSVGKEVRSAIEKIGGTMPEDLPTPEKSIQEIEREQMARLKAKAKAGKLMLDE